MSFKHFTQCNLNKEVYGFYSQDFFFSLFCRSMSLYVPGLLHCSTIHINCLCLFCVSTCFCVCDSMHCVQRTVCIASVKLWSCLLFMLSTLSSNTPHTKRGVAVNKHACMWECVRMHVRLLCVYVCMCYSVFVCMLFYACVCA